MLSGHDELLICDAYEIDGKRYLDFPTTEKLYRAKPSYIKMKGWKEDITHIRDYFELPIAARNYIEKIEELVGVHIKYVSVGPERDQLIKR